MEGGLQLKNVERPLRRVGTLGPPSLCPRPLGSGHPDPPRADRDRPGVESFRKHDDTVLSTCHRGH